MANVLFSLLEKPFNIKRKGGHEGEAFGHRAVKVVVFGAIVQQIVGSKGEDYEMKITF